MKKELREAIELDKAYQEKSGFSKLIEKNQDVIKALGIASFLALAGFSTAQLLKDKKLMKKIKDGVKSPKALQYIEKIFKLQAFKTVKNSKAVKTIASVIEKEDSPKNTKIKNNSKTSATEKKTKPAAPKKATKPAATKSKTTTKKAAPEAKSKSTKKKSS